jgi:hypothetical protein
MAQEHENALWLLDVLYQFQGLVVEDDIKDFPWDPIANGDPYTGTGGHVPGMPHHGMLAFMGQQVTKLVALGVMGAKLAEEMQPVEEEQIFQEEMAFWEKLAYPEGEITDLPRERYQALPSKAK